MPDLKRLYFLLLCFGIPLAGLKAQAPPVIKFPAVEAWFQAENDTLYVINFWATWCRPCVAEMPFFDEVQREMEGDKVKVLFVSMDFIDDMDKRLIPFLKKKKLYSDVFLLDEPKYHLWIDLVSEEWSGAIPATIFVQKSKDIRHFHEGEFTYEELKTQIESLIH